MTEWQEDEIPTPPGGPVFKRVHIGGHHEVWCNGTIHLHRDGGHCVPYDLGRPDTRKPWNPEDYPCNCADYAPGGKLHVPINGHGSKRGRR